MGLDGLMIKIGYYEINGCIVHVKDTHYQPADGMVLLELDDWAGKGIYNISSYYILNNGNMIMPIGLQAQMFFKLSDVYSLQSELIKEMNRVIGEIKKSNNIMCEINFKQSKIRLDIIRKYYGNKSTNMQSLQNP
jgi:hypothetical protein